MNEARTSREALIAVMLGDIDKILERAEALPEKVAQAEATLKTSTAALETASDKYRMAITAFTDEARTELVEFLQRKAGEVAAKTVEEQRTAMQEAARAAFRSNASDRAEQLGIALGQAAKEFRRSMGSRLIEHGLTALLAAGLTGAILIYFK